MKTVKNSDTKRRVVAVVSVVLITVVLAWITWMVCRRLNQIGSAPEDFKSFIHSFGAAGWFVALGLQMLQVLVALIPGEVVEIGLGAAFGAWKGTFICLMGILLASSAVFLLVKCFGVKVLELFFDVEKINGLRFINSENKLNRMVFLLFFIPGTPKDLLTYFVGLTNMTLPRFLLVSTIARIPSVVSSTIGGSLISAGEYLSAAILFGLTGVVSLSGMLLYENMVKRKRYGHISACARKVITLFLKICAIPHGSGETAALARFCLRFAARHDMKAEIDNAGNVWIETPASPGYETQPPIILQAHLDMVCAKTEGSKKDMQRQGVTPVFSGDILTAKETTLGADNGIGVAMILSVLQDKTLVHPRLQVLLTADEETGMFGANGVKTERFIGQKLINLDGEEEGVFIVGCAGGMRQTCSMTRERSLLHGRLLSVKLSNLTGGHSGVDIGFGRANANKLMAQVLFDLQKEIGVALAAFSGGVADNAIPSFAAVSLVIPEETVEKATAFLQEQQREVKQRFAHTDPSLDFEITVGETGDFISFLPEDTKAVFEWLCGLPDGVQTESKAFPGKPETSLNLGIVSCDNDTITATFSLRSFSKEKLHKLCEQVQKITAGFGGVTTQGAAYPAWEYAGETPLLQTAKQVYKRQFEREPVTDIIHAGLECGVFCGQVQGMQCISFGPEMSGVHTPEEAVSLSSIERTYAFLCALLTEKE